MLTSIIVVFVMGYIAIAFEHRIRVNKAASAILIGVICWTLYALGSDSLLLSKDVPAWFLEKLGGDAGEHLNREYHVDGQ
jgi:hypothetical protein